MSPEPHSRVAVRDTWSSAHARKRWGWAQYLAVLGVPILVLNAWTVIAWLADGPAPVTEFRDPNSANWYVARTVEGLAILGSVFMIIHLVRGCRRSGRILTLDVMFCMVGATLFWIDFGVSFFQPVFLASSNFINVNNTCGHMPFVVNPDCGQAPDPILFFWLLETFLFLASVKLVVGLANRIKLARPALTERGMIGVLMGAAMVFSLGEIVMVGLGIWTYTGPQWMSFSPGHGGQYNVVVLLETTLIFGLLTLVYFIRDDRGQTIAERGLEHYPEPKRKAITLLALYGVIQLVCWLPGSMPVAALSFFQDGWAKMPRYLVSDVCDAPGIARTRYGPCPGSSGFRMPVRHSLPGRSP